MKKADLAFMLNVTIINVSLCKKDAKTYFLFLISSNIFFFIFLLPPPPSAPFLVYACNVCILLNMVFR